MPNFVSLWTAEKKYKYWRKLSNCNILPHFIFFSDILTDLIKKKPSRLAPNPVTPRWLQEQRGARQAQLYDLRAEAYYYAHFYWWNHNFSSKNQSWHIYIVIINFWRNRGGVMIKFGNYIRIGESKYQFTKMLSFQSHFDKLDVVNPILWVNVITLNSSKDFHIFWKKSNFWYYLKYSFNFLHKSKLTNWDLFNDT